MTDPDGVASLTMLTDARDVAAGMAAMIEPAEAVGEAFNIGPEAPHSDRELVGELGKRLGLDVVEIPSELVRPSWYVSSAKARGVLGYRPRYTVFDMIAEATGEAGA
jgi:nucleoside-diphosphate-sugar epimerase